MTKEEYEIAFVKAQYETMGWEKQGEPSKFAWLDEGVKT